MYISKELKILNILKIYKGIDIIFSSFKCSTKVSSFNQGFKLTSQTPPEGDPTKHAQGTSYLKKTLPIRVYLFFTKV